MRLRSAQREILTYRGGRTAISAVPGSGKTFTLALLATELLSDGMLEPARGEEVLIVTYMTASVEAFRSRIRQQLLERELPLRGVDVRTLHSLSLEIIRTASGYATVGNSQLIVADESQQGHYLATAVNGWIEANHSFWQAFLPESADRFKVRWRRITEQTARAFIRAAKNERLRPERILARVQAGSADSPTQSSDYALVQMLAGIYWRYQHILERQGVVDYDDLIWQAAQQMEERADLRQAFAERWPFVLEDEAQDSIPLQEDLLEAVTGPSGNWIRVGDPNQSITSTFTAAHPRHFLAFLRRPNVKTLPLPNSGRSAPLIFEAANRLVEWACNSHPVEEVRERAFRPQTILPTPPGDAQPNPSDHDATFRIRVFRHREEREIPAVAHAATAYVRRYPEQTVAILVPTNEVGYDTVPHLDQLRAPYDDLLRGSGRQRDVAAVVSALLTLIADPLSNQALVDVYVKLHDVEHETVSVSHEMADRLKILLRSIHEPELLLFADRRQQLSRALPTGIASEEEKAALEKLGGFLAQVFALASLPPGDLILSLGDLLFADPAPNRQSDSASLTVAYQLSHAVRRWLDTQPEWRLPELASQMSSIASGRQSLPGSYSDTAGFQPRPGRITLTTQHGAKGMEWDAVYLLGIDGFWIPDDLQAGFLGVHQFLGGDPAAEAVAQLRLLMYGDAGLYPGRDATESAHIDVISERLRLLYVGITRARRFLQISRSRAVRRYGREYDATPTAALGVLHRYLQHARPGERSDHD
ncbi:MAG: ATP-dependent helicase [Candidatus Promineifilaceae bacterium]|nr:ATP-dependent helicase [Candidatus Promineifilaceae bacterium]